MMFMCFMPCLYSLSLCDSYFGYILTPIADWTPTLLWCRYSWRRIVEVLSWRTIKSISRYFLSLVGVFYFILGQALIL